METCTNCGAALRPGARFCTTCGTRVNEKPTDNGGWGVPAVSEDDSQQTSVLEAVPLSEPDVASPVQERQRDWGSAYSTTSAADPASNFRSALDAEVQPVTDEGWGAPRQTTDNWNFSAATDDTWKAPATWGTVTPEVEEDAETEPASATDVDEVVEDTAQPEEVEAIALPETPATLPNEPAGEASTLTDTHTRALELLKELQTIVPQLAASQADEGTAAMTLTEASLQVKDYSDVAATLNAVKENPRDIQVLGDLAAKADRIQELLDEHSALAQAIEDAIGHLSEG
ncbi:MAG: zinc-ribbon domain-containing protein [Thermomicrobiales bacterium]|nr:zinc-ribbon domain-containing protein [Thermomicrobiales bacterium]